MFPLEPWQMILGAIALLPLYVGGWAFWFRFLEKEKDALLVVDGFLATFWPIVFPLVLGVIVVLGLMVIAAGLIFALVMSWVAFLTGGFPKLYRSFADFVG